MRKGMTLIELFIVVAIAAIVITLVYSDVTMNSDDLPPGCHETWRMGRYCLVCPQGVDCR